MQNNYKEARKTTEICKTIIVRQNTVKEKDKAAKTERPTTT